MHADAAEPRVPLLDWNADTEAVITRVYLAVVQHAEPTRSLLIAQGMPADAVDHSLATLAERGLVRLHDHGVIEVLPPDIAMPALATEFERRARATRAVAHEIAQVFFQARSTSNPPDADAIRVLRSLDEVAAATAEAISSGRERVRCFRSLSPRTRRIFDSPQHSHEQPTTGAGGVVLEMTSVYDTKVLELEGALDVLKARERGGERYRLATSVPFSAVIIDESAAVVDLSCFEPTGEGSALVRTRPLVLALAALADLLWNLGSPLLHSGSRLAERRDQTILALLAAGAPDATIARQVGVSQRTVERRVRALMDQLDAGTRFQAGVQAARSGLV